MQNNLPVTHQDQRHDDAEQQEDEDHNGATEESPETSNPASSPP